jgi:hypothetical protein
MPTQPFTKPSPTITNAPSSNSHLYNVPAILLKGKGKSKLILDDDDVPFAQLTKQICGQNSLANILSEIEMAALSLTNL